MARGAQAPPLPPADCEIPAAQIQPLPHRARGRKCWLSATIALALAACSGAGGVDAGGVAPVALASAPPGEAQRVVELELRPEEITRWRALLAAMTSAERAALLSFLARFDEGLAGVTIGRHFLPKPEFAQELAKILVALGPEYEAGLARELGVDYHTRIDALRRALPAGNERDALVDALRLFSVAGHCFYSQAEMDALDLSGVAGVTIGLCDPAVEAFDHDWNFAPPMMVQAEPAGDGEAPWQVQLIRAGKDRAFYQRPIRARYEFERLGRRLEPWERDHVCGAVYIGGKHALTAAHCLEGWDGYDADFFDGRRIRAGTHDITVEGEVIPITAAVIHAGYSDGKAYAGYDIALLVLAKAPANAEASRVRIPLHPRNGRPPGTTLVQTGWGLMGATESTRRARDITGNLQRSARWLRIGQLQLYDNAKCDGDPAFAERGVSIGHGQLCVGSEEGVDACKGDSGGPLVRMVEGELPILVGLVSWGIGCGIRGRPAIYTDVGTFYSWIKQAQLFARPGRLLRLGRQRAAR